MALERTGDQGRRHTRDDRFGFPDEMSPRHPYDAQAGRDEVGARFVEARGRVQGSSR